jgi:hypothetical protein
MQAGQMIASDPSNAEVLMPYLNGEDLNSRPDQSPSRWVINFWDWPEERAAKYKLPFQWIKEHVYPERLEKSKEKSYKNIMRMWWLHWNSRVGLYNAIGRGNSFQTYHAKDLLNNGDFKNVIALTRVSKYLNVAIIPNNSIFTLDLFVFTKNGFDDFALFQSNIFVSWAWSRGGRMKHDLRFSGTDVLETFPFPRNHNVDALKDLGEKFHFLRAEEMKKRAIGLTKFTNLIHSPDADDLVVRQIRDIWAEIDVTVLNAYGWSDINLNHGFHNVAYRPTSDQLRFTISEDARIEVLSRLTKLNRVRYEEEKLESLAIDSTSEFSLKGKQVRKIRHDATSQSSLDI